MKGFSEPDSSPENMNIITRMKTGQSTESLDSLSDESGSHHNRGNPVPTPRKVRIIYRVRFPDFESCFSFEQFQKLYFLFSSETTSLG